MHGVEERVEPPYLFSAPLTYRLVLADGKVIEKTYRRHSFRGWTQRYDRVADVLREPHLHEGARPRRHRSRDRGRRAVGGSRRRPPPRPAVFRR